ncbi:MAG: hypothetical protein AAFU03_17340 [Bacteroidota bacterium]
MKNHMYRLILVSSLILAISCSSYAQPKDTVSYRELTDLAYLPTGDSLQMLNLILPQTGNKPPLLLWVGGGAWAFVNRHQEMPLARKIARQGIAVASVGHRLSTAEWVDPERTEGVKHPDHTEDVAAAFHWLKTHAEE